MLIRNEKVRAQRTSRCWRDNKPAFHEFGCSQINAEHSRHLTFGRHLFAPDYSEASQASSMSTISSISQSAWSRLQPSLAWSAASYGCERNCSTSRTAQLNAAWFSIFFENALVSRVKRRVCIRTLRFWRSANDVPMYFGSGCPRSGSCGRRCTRRGCSVFPRPGFRHRASQVARNPHRHRRAFNGFKICLVTVAGQLEIQRSPLPACTVARSFRQG